MIEFRCRPVAAVARQAGLCLMLAMMLPFEALPQAVTGVVSGAVVDSSGAVIPAASVTLLNENTGDKRDMPAGADGSFVFSAVFPGRYTLRIEANGFKRLERANINVAASERASLGELALQVGSTSDAVTVAAEAPLLQTSTAERSAVLTTDQVSNLASSGRMVLGLLKTLPGIPNPGETGGLPNVNGLKTGYVNMTTDGTPNLELGNAFSSTRPHLDSISEVKVLTNNFQAEYGATAGAIIQIVTKSGTSQFHGTGYMYKQHESFNANSYFNNANRVARAISRNTIWGYAIGGPVYIPGKFNVDKNKLFFFWTQEFRKLPFNNTLRQSTVPTELERSGDFSQTLDVGGRLIVVRDPLTGQPFAGNVIPPDRIDRNGQRLLSVFPLPNFTNRAASLGNYNYQVQQPGQNPRKQFVTRVDYNITSNVRLYLRGIREMNREYGWQYQDTTPQILGLNQIPKNDVGANSTQILSPTVVNEVLLGMHHRSEYRSVAPASNPMAIDSAAALEGYTRSALGINLPLLYNNNPFNVIPGMTFADVPNAMNLNWTAGGYFPPTTSERAWIFSDSLTKVWGAHTLKGGIAVNHRFRMNTGNGNAAGLFAFGRNVNNANDANYGYANALLGNFTQYTESTTIPLTKDSQVGIEWFLQDTWKASRKLSLDYGMRFTWFTPWAQGDGRASNFQAELWDPRRAPVLYQPALNERNQRVARNPLTGEFAAAPLIGALVPTSGDPANGMALGTDDAFPKGFLENQGVLFGPRIGIAYDLTGDGKTALRLGAGIFYQTQFTNTETVFVTNPPIQFSPTIYFGSLNNYSNATGVIFPSNNVRGIVPSGQAPTVYNYSFGIQRDIGFNTVLDVAYVGNQSRHQTQTRNINTLPWGARFQPQSQDPTRPGSPLADDFLRPYPGYGNIMVSDRTGNANYNSLQVQANRRFSRGLQFGISYTWSKAMGYDDSPSIYQDARFWNYGRLSYDFTHMAVMNWVWDIPVTGWMSQHLVTRTLLGGWNLAGIATFQTGSPLNIGFTTEDGADLTGGGDAIRIDVVGSPHLSKGERSFTRWFDPTVFRRPARGTPGTLGRGLLSNPGVSNFDLTLSKQFSMRERLRFKLLFEAFNAFNHSQFSAVDSTARFDVAGNQRNPRFGQITAARNPRVGQLSLRVTF